jgi:hypothetical protein
MHFMEFYGTITWTKCIHRYPTWISGKAYITHLIEEPRIGGY